jgi:hypothetical protein
MGGLINKIFGGGSTKAADRSLAYQQQMDARNQEMMSPFIQSGVNNTNFLNQALTGSGAEQESAFQRWLDSGDYKFAQSAGLDAINSNAAAKGLLKSGATLKATTDFGQKLGMGYRDNWMNKIMGMASQGQNAAGQMVGANQTSAGMYGNMQMNRAANKAQGFNNFLDFGMGVAKFASDRRLKTAIRKVGEFADGLGIYTYRYIVGGPTMTGVMADEVARLRPQALGPAFGPYQTVDYGNL